MAGLADLPPGSSRVEFVLTPTPRGTTVSLRHTNLPESRSRGHAAGWTNYIDRLAAAARGMDPGPDTWRPAAT